MIYSELENYGEIMEDKVETYFIDLDGTLVRHHADPKDYPATAEILPGVLDNLLDLKARKCYTVLTTGRSKSDAAPVLKQLKLLGFEFNQCIYDLPTGCRTLVNDRSETGETKAFAISLTRNRGWK